MKKQWLIFLFLSFTIASTTHAQYSYNPFRIDLGGGLSQSFANDYGVGFSMHAEPKYDIDKLSLGLRFSYNCIFKNLNDYYYNYDDTFSGFIMPMNFSWLATVDYHFTSGTFRPFVGGGVGFHVLTVGVERYYDYYDYHHYYDDEDYYYDWYNYGVKFGGMIRTGFDVGHFRMAIEYNFVGDSRAKSQHNNRRHEYNNNRRTLNFDYFSITASAFIGGGKR